MIEIFGTELNQWDTGRSVKVTEIEADKVHFANKGDSKAVIMDIADSMAKIPDYLLYTGKQLCVYAVKNGVTIESKIFYVKNRERPENYVYEDDQRNYIYTLIANAETATKDANQAATGANTAKDSANLAAQNANNSANSASLAANKANGAADEANRVAQYLLDARNSGEFTGPGIAIVGTYGTEAQLVAANPPCAPGEYYLVGNDLYTWSQKENRWVNIGPIQGTYGYAPAITITTEEALSAALLTTYQSMSDGYSKTFRMSITVANLSIGGGIWFVTVYRSTTNYGFAEAVRYGGSGGLIYTNNLQEGTWSGWVNISPSQYAPNGYGLGTMGKTCSDCNTAKNNGWYSLSGESCLNAPTSYSNMKYGSMLVLNRFDSYIA